MQDETITVMDLGDRPASVTIPRRVAFRYVKIELLASLQYFDFNISNIEFKASTSAAIIPSVLSAGTEQLIKDIDRVGCTTLISFFEHKQRRKYLFHKACIMEAPPIPDSIYQEKV